MTRHCVLLLVPTLIVGIFIYIPESAHPQPSTVRRENHNSRGFTLSFRDDEMRVELSEHLVATDITAHRLTRRSTADAPLDRTAFTRTSPSDAKKQGFRLDTSGRSNEIIPVEITIADPEESEPVVSIVYVKRLNGKMTETTWSEYVCSQKIYVCGKDWKGRPAMRLPARQ